MPKNRAVKNKKKITTKNIVANTNDFLVHEFAIRPFQIYCEYFPISFLKQNRKLANTKSLFFDVVKQHEKCYFFDNFDEVILLNNNSQVTVRQLMLSSKDIERRSWAYLIDKFINLKPINPEIFQTIKQSMPDEIAKELFGQSLTIEKILHEMGLSRHHYDYQASLQRNKRSHLLPSFSQLILETSN